MEGLTIRDYFAGKALQSILLAAPTLSPEQACCDAYAFADEMLLVREREPVQEESEVA